MEADDKTPQVNPAPGPAMPGPKPSATNKIVLVLIAVLLVAGVFIWLAVNHSANKAGPYKQKYSQNQLFGDYIAGQGSGNGMSFQVPSNFSPVSPGNIAYISYYGQLGWQTANTPMLGAEVALSTSGPNASEMAYTAKNLASPSTSKIYQDATLPAQALLSHNINYLYFSSNQKAPSIQLGQAVKTSNSNLQSAWLIPFTATGQSPTSDQRLNNLSGELLWAFGKTNYYYVMLSSISDNWQPNHGTWDKIINSVKIDQVRASSASSSTTGNAASKFTCYDSYNQAFVHTDVCTNLELQSKAYDTGAGCYNKNGDFLTEGNCNE